MKKAWHNNQRQKETRRRANKNNWGKDHDSLPEGSANVLSQMMNENAQKHVPSKRKYTGLSGRTELPYFTDIPVRKVQTKSIPVTSWKIEVNPFPQCLFLCCLVPTSNRLYSAQRPHAVLLWYRSCCSTSVCLLRCLQPALLHVQSLEIQPAWPGRHFLNIFLQLSVITRIWFHTITS